MSKIGIYCETQNGNPKSATRELVTLARQSSREVVGALFHGDAQATSEALSPFGLDRIVHIQGEPVANYHPEVYAEHLAGVIDEQAITDFIAIDTGQAKDLLPRLAAHLAAPLATDCVGVDLEAGEAIKPMYSGKANARLRLHGDIRLYTLRPNSVVAEPTGGGAAPISTFDAAAHTTRAEIRDIAQSISGKMELTEAPIIVSGGYGMGSAENFQVLEALADVLGAAVGASRRAVDEGLAPYELQVGQTGKVVNPQLYIACGISGAVQHFAGMKSAKTIVAINKDPDAPIFQKAHYGIVGDLFQVVPILTEEFRRLRQP